MNTCSDVESFLQLVKMMQEQEQNIPKVESEKENENTTSQVIEVKSLKELKDQIAISKGPIFVDCYGNSCPPCGCN